MRYHPEATTAQELLLCIGYEIRDHPERLLLEFDGPGARFADGSHCSHMGHPDAVKWRATSFLVRETGEHAGMAKATPSNELLWECQKHLLNAKMTSIHHVERTLLSAEEVSTWYRFAAMMAG